MGAALYAECEGGIEGVVSGGIEGVVRGALGESLRKDRVRAEGER